jgi:hypothetical protein
VAEREKTFEERDAGRDGREAEGSRPERRNDVGQNHPMARPRSEGEPRPTPARLAKGRRMRPTLLVLSLLSRFSFIATEVAVH